MEKFMCRNLVNVRMNDDSFANYFTDKCYLILLLSLCMLEILYGYNVPSVGFSVHLPT